MRNSFFSHLRGFYNAMGESRSRHHETFPKCCKIRYYINHMQSNMKLNMWDFSFFAQEARQPVCDRRWGRVTREEHSSAKDRTDQFVVLPPHLLLIQGMTTNWSVGFSTLSLSYRPREEGRKRRKGKKKKARLDLTQCRCPSCFLLSVCWLFNTSYHIYK